jgi:phospholipase D1/2
MDPPATKTDGLHSTVVGDVKVENKIGDALVHRIIKADRDGTPWKCCIMIPLMPGFSFSVDHGDASAVSVDLRLCTP